MTNPLSSILARAKNGARGSQPPAGTHLDPITRMRAAAEVLRQSAQRVQYVRKLARARDGK